MVARMEGFYSKEQAANILGVSTRQVNNYIREGKLRRIQEGGRAWIPRQDVQTLYDDRSLIQVPTLKDITNLHQRMEQLEKQMKVLQRGLGFGSSGELRDDTYLRLLFQQTMDDLGQPSWPINKIMEYTDELSRFREEELDRLLSLRGPQAMVPFFELARRMVSYIETHDQYPSQGLQGVRDRLLQARRNVLALIEVTMRIEPSGFSESARVLYQNMGERSDFISDQIGSYILKV